MISFQPAFIKVRIRPARSRTSVSMLRESFQPSLCPRLSIVPASVQAEPVGSPFSPEPRHCHPRSASAVRKRSCVSNCPVELSLAENWSPASPPWTSLAMGEAAGLAVAVTDGIVDHSQSITHRVPPTDSVAATCWATSMRRPSANRTTRPGVDVNGFARFATERPFELMSPCK